MFLVHVSNHTQKMVSTSKNYILDLTTCWDVSTNREAVAITLCGGEQLLVTDIPFYLFVKPINQELSLSEFAQQLAQHLQSCRISSRTIYPPCVRDRSNFRLKVTQVSGKSFVGYKPGNVLEDFWKVEFAYSFVADAVMKFAETRKDVVEIYEFHKTPVAQLQALTGLGSFDIVTLPTEKICSLDKLQAVQADSEVSLDCALSVLYLEVSESEQGEYVIQCLVEGQQEAWFEGTRDGLESISEFVKYLEIVNPDVVIGSNFVRDHLRLLIGKAKQLNIDLLKRWSRVSGIDARLVEINSVLIFDCPGRLFIDIVPFSRDLDLFKLDEYSLASIAAQLEISREIGGLDLLPEIRHKLLLIETVIIKSRLLRTRASDIVDRGNGLAMYNLLHSQTRNLYFVPYSNPVKFLRETKGHQYVWDAKLSHKSGSGGHVFAPEIGRYFGCIATVDFSSMYPSQIQTFNISHDTLLQSAPDFCLSDMPDYIGDKFNIWEDDCLVDEKLREIPHWTSPNGFAFASQPEGILPKLCTMLTDRRNQIREQMKSLERDSAEYRVRDLLQQQLKISTNAIYGLCASGFSSLCNLAVSSAITACGRKQISDLKTHIEEKFSLDNISLNNGILVNSLYGDTDSLMLLIKKFDKSEFGEWVEIQDTSDYWERAEGLVSYLNTESGLIHGKLKLVLEDVSDQIIFWCKKKYCKFRLPPPCSPACILPPKSASLATRSTFPFYRDTIKQLMELLRDPSNRSAIKILLSSAVQKIPTLEANQLVLSVKIHKSAEEAKSGTSVSAKLVSKLATAGVTVMKGDRVSYLHILERGEDTVMPLQLYRENVHEINRTEYARLFCQTLEPLVVPLLFCQAEFAVVVGTQSRTVQQSVSQSSRKKTKLSISQIMEG